METEHVPGSVFNEITAMTPDTPRHNFINALVVSLN